MPPNPAPWDGVPRSPEELLRHRLLDHRSSYHDDDGDWNDWFALARAANLIMYRTNTSSSLLSAIQTGLGIGMLPTYSSIAVDGIVPLSIGVRTRSDIWLTFHPSIQNTARMRAVIDWIRNLFDKNVWPWFRDEFHPPEVPPAKIRAQAVLALRSFT